MNFYFDANGNVRTPRLALTSGFLTVAYLFSFVIGVSQVREPGMHPMLSCTEARYTPD